MIKVIEQRYTARFIICSRHNQIFGNDNQPNFLRFDMSPANISFTMSVSYLNQTYAKKKNKFNSSFTSLFWYPYKYRYLISKLIRISLWISFHSRKDKKYYNYQARNNLGWLYFIIIFLTRYIVSETKYMTKKRIIFFFKYFRLGH